MINEVKITQYIPECDTCGWTGGRHSRPTMAEWALRNHQCGVHKPAFRSDGGYRGMLGGTRRDCVCGASYVVHDDSEPFKCPEDKS